MKERIRDWLRSVFESVTVRLTREHQGALRILSKQILCHRVLVAVIVLMNLGASVFEGGTIAILGVAVSVLVEDTSDSVFGQFGMLGSFFENLTTGYGRESLFLVLVGTAVGAQVLKNAFTYLGKLVTIRLQYRVTRELQERVTGQLMAFSYSEVGRHPSGYINELIKQSGKFAGTIVLFNKMIIVAFMFIMYVGLMLIMSIPLTLAAIVVIALVGISLKGVVRRLQRLGRHIMWAGMDMSRMVFEYLNAQRLLRVFNATKIAEKTINKSRAEVIRSMEKSQQIKSAVEPLTDTVIIIGAGLFLVLGYYTAGEDATSVLPTLMLFILVLNRMMPQVKEYNQARLSFANTLPMMERVTAFLREDDKSFIRRGGEIFNGLENSIRFENVRFRYPDTEFDALDGISFEIEKGKTVALVGTSGAGKSTISDLLLGLYEPTAGRILIDGKNLRKIKLSSWLRDVGVVDQEIFLLDASVKENISFAATGYTDREIEDASRAAHAHEFIKALPNGYDTSIGSRGYRLSGGQKQRLALARALLRNPSILIMDEATSALDSESEQKIQRTLEELHQSRTMLLIAHRLSTIAYADTIITLKDGRIIEKGTKKELLANAGKFAELWNLQTDQALKG